MTQHRYHILMTHLRTGDRPNYLCGLVAGGYVIETALIGKPPTHLSRLNVQIVRNLSTLML